MVGRIFHKAQLNVIWLFMQISFALSTLSWIKRRNRVLSLLCDDILALFSVRVRPKFIFGIQF